MSDISIERGTFTKQVDLAMATSVSSASNIDLGATDGNTVIILGTTTINSLGTAPQAGVRRTLVFAGSLTLTYGVNLLCLGEANMTTDTGDVCEFVALTTTQWKMISYSKYNGITNGKINDTGLNNGAVTPSRIKTKGLVQLIDTATTLTAANLVNKSIFTAVPTANRIQTTDSAVNIIAALPNYQIGTWFEFTIVNTAAFNETLSPGTDVTIFGNAVVNNGSATFIAVVMSSTEVSIFRK